MDTMADEGNATRDDFTAMANAMKLWRFYEKMWAG